MSCHVLPNSQVAFVKHQQVHGTTIKRHWDPGCCLNTTQQLLDVNPEGLRSVISSIPKGATSPAASPGRAACRMGRNAWGEMLSPSMKSVVVSGGRANKKGETAKHQEWATPQPPKTTGHRLTPTSRTGIVYMDLTSPNWRVFYLFK